MGRNADNIVGVRYGRLVVVERVPFTRDENGASTFTSKWRCVCDCGGQIATRRGNLTGGSTQSCGCLRREKARSLTDRYRDVSDLA